MMGQADDTPLIHRQSNDVSAKASHGSLETSMGDFFPEQISSSSDSTRAQYRDAEIMQISALLQQTNLKWSQVPRLYTVLRLIGQLHLLDAFIAQGITDFWFPFSIATLPDSINLATRTDFVNVQHLVLTKSVDLEKGENGKHRNFAKGEPLPFESKAILGSGGFGQVDKVLSLVSYKEYARKRIRRGKVFKRAQEYMKAFKAELEVLKRLKHRHIVEYVGSYTDSTFVGLIMSPVADGNLLEFLDSAVSKLEDKKTLLRNFFGCLCNALAYLHSSHIRHKDIKPHNILVKGDIVLFTDFGVSLDWSETSQSMTEGLTALTPRYCAPEVAEYEPRGSSSDIWSLGCVFLEMLTVLKGETVEVMKAFYDSTGTHSRHFRNNPQASEQWMLKLETVSGARSDNVPVVWIRKMLQVNRVARPTAMEVVEMITKPELENAAKTAFCGVCCLEDDESSDDLSSDSDMVETPEGIGSLLSRDPLINTPSDERSSLSKGKASIELQVHPPRLRDGQKTSDAGASIPGEVRRMMIDADASEIRLAEDGLSLQGKEEKSGAEVKPLKAPHEDKLGTAESYSAAALSSWVSIKVKGSKEATSDTDIGAKEAPRNQELILNKNNPKHPKGLFSIRDWPKIFQAVQEKSKEKVESLLKKEAALPSFGLHTLDSKDSNGSTLLYQAILDGQVGIVRVLLKYGADPNVAKGRWPGETCLQQATLLGREDLVQLLLDHGANIATSDAVHMTALGAAAKKGNIALASLLLKHGADINQKGPRSITASTIAVENTQVEMLEFLLSQGADVTADKTSLESALKQDHMGMVELLFKNSAASNLSHKELGSMLVDRARSGRDPKLVALLLEYGASVDVDKGAALESAIDCFEQNPIIGLLLDHGAETQLKRTPYEKTLEEKALRKGNAEIVKVFLDKGLGSRTREDVVKLYIHHCSTLPDGMGHAVVKYLVLEEGYSGPLKTELTYPKHGTVVSPLQWAAMNRDLGMVRIRLEKGDDVEGLSTAHTPLQYACMSSSEDMVKALLAAGAKPNNIGQHRIGPLIRPADTPLQLAVVRKQLGIAILLLEAGADANTVSPTSSPLAAAAQRGDDAFVDLLLRHGARPLLTGYYFADPFCAAVYFGHVEVARRLLEPKGGISAEEMRSLGPKAVQVAAEKGLVDIVKLLLDMGADVNGWWNNKNVLFAATREGNEDVVQLLVERGADPNAKGNSSGMSAMQKGVKTNDEMLIKALSGAAKAGELSDNSLS